MKGWVTARAPNNAVNFAFEAARESHQSPGLFTFLRFLIFGSVVGVLWFGAQSVWPVTCRRGHSGSFCSIRFLQRGALGGLSEVWGELSQAAGATERLVDCLRRSPISQLPPIRLRLPSPARGEIRFEDVSFAYPARKDAPVARKLSFAVKPGETVALVGPSCAGKSTIFSLLLLRFYDPRPAHLIDGVDLRATAFAGAPAHGGGAQDVTIFAGKRGKDNIAFWQSGSDKSAVLSAAKAAYCP